jgi:hypothetical protein
MNGHQQVAAEPNLESLLPATAEPPKLRDLRMMSMSSKSFNVLVFVFYLLVPFLLWLLHYIFLNLKNNNILVSSIHR